MSANLEKADFLVPSDQKFYLVEDLAINPTLTQKAGGEGLGVVN